jgi:hypothetical protein
MQDEKIITFETYHDPMLAHIIRSKLDANDIPCFIEDDHMAGLNALYKQSVGIKLKIFERDLEKCRELINEPETILADHTDIDPETDYTIICPFCASTNVERVDNSNRPDWVNSLYNFSAAIFPFYTPKQWHCFNCKQDFE